MINRKPGRRNSSILCVVSNSRKTSFKFSKLQASKGTNSSFTELVYTKQRSWGRIKHTRKSANIQRCKTLLYKEGQNGRGHFQSKTPKIRLDKEKFSRPSLLTIHSDTIEADSSQPQAHLVLYVVSRQKSNRKYGIFQIA